MFLPYVFVPAGRSCLWLPDFIGLCWTVHPVNQKIRVQDHHYVTVGLHRAGGCSFSCDDHKRAAVLHLNAASSRVLRDINRLHYRCMYFIHLCVLFNHPKCLAIFEKCFAGVSSQFVLRWLCDTSVKSPTANKKALRRCVNTENDIFVASEMFPDNDIAEADSDEEEDFYFSEND